MRKPRKNTPVRQVRLATGLSQKAFAAYLGLGVPLYHKLELGSARLTEDNAESIALRTGATPESLDHKSSTIALDTSGKPYTLISWEQWRNGRWAGPWAQATDLLQWTEFLCKIAQKADKLPELCFELCDCLTRARDKFDLHAAVNTELGRTKAQSGFICTYGELRANKQLGKQVGFTGAESDKPDAEVWNGTIKYTPTWSPHTLFPVELANQFGISPRPQI